MKVTDIGGDLTLALFNRMRQEFGAVATVELATGVFIATLAVLIQELGRDQVDKIIEWATDEHRPS